MDYINDKLRVFACVLMFFIVTMGWGLGAHAAGDAAALFQNANKDYVDLVRDAAKKKVRDNWLKVINEYLGIGDKYPDSDLAPEACSRGAKVYEHFSKYSGRKSDLEAASRVYQDLAGKYPKSALADDALYSAAQVEEKLGNSGKAESLYRRILDDYSQGDMADRAGLKLNGKPSEVKAAKKAYQEKGPSPYGGEKTAKKIPADKGAQTAASGRAGMKSSGEKRPQAISGTEASQQSSTEKVAQVAALEREAQKAPSDKAEEKLPASSPTEGAEPMKLGTPSRVKKISHTANDEASQVVIELDNASATYKAFVAPEDKALKKPVRLVVDLKGARIPRGIPSSEAVDEGIITSIRASGHSDNMVRIVLDLKEKPSFQISRADDPARVVIDVGSGKALLKAPAAVQADAHEGTAPPYQAQQVKKVPRGTHAQLKKDLPSIASQLCLKVSKIVVDPGHGGKDPGAISPTGVKEKDLTLEIGKLLAKKLKEEGFEVYLTRTRDEFVALEERTTYANKKRADLFLSIHINSHQNNAVSGIETYFLNLTTDSSAIEVAARENTYSDKSMSDLQLILNDLMLNSKINESSKFANYVHTNVMTSAANTGYDGKNLGVRQAPFYVLLGAQMPSILIELGFLTNSTDITLLKKHSYQETLVDGIAKGINSYIMNTTYAYSWRNK
jgi:N-acetylmuramoyl-L-alanine amidase